MTLTACIDELEKAKTDEELVNATRTLRELFKMNDISETDSDLTSEVLELIGSNFAKLLLTFAVIDGEPSECIKSALITVLAMVSKNATLITHSKFLMFLPLIGNAITHFDANVVVVCFLLCLLIRI
jgi:hypothetical protein